MQNSSTPLASNQNAKCSESCRNRGLPTVCWMTPKLPAGGICGGPTKLGKKLTSLFGASKSGWLKNGRQAANRGHGMAFLKISKPTVIAKPVANVQEDLDNFQ